MGLKNRKIIPLLLMSAIMVANISISPAYAYNNTDTENGSYLDVDNYKLVETSNGFILEYNQLENNETVYYHEKLENNEVYTKKYIKENEDFKLVEELNTTIKVEENNDGSEVIKAEINNITNNNVTNEVVMESESNQSQEIGRVKRAANIRRHPLDSNYVFFTGISSHLGFARLTKAAAMGVIAAAVGNGKLAASVITTVITTALQGGYSNLYYRKDSYYPIKKKGNPTVKYVTKFYLDKGHKKQCGKTVYTDSGIYNK